LSAANLRIVTTATTTTLPEIDFGELAGPVESSVAPFDLLNDGAAAETAVDCGLYAEESDDGGVTWYSGVISNGRWLQVRATGQSGTGITPQSTSWVPVGVGARLYLSPIPANCRRVLEAKLVVPAGNATASKKIRIIAFRSENVTPLPAGTHESGQRGVLSGTGDPEQTYLLTGGAVTATTPTADGNINIAAVQWVEQGTPHSHYGGTRAISASASGNARWVTVSLGAAWPPTLTASAEVTAPAPVGDRPALPAGEAFVCFVHRDDGTIIQDDIYTDAQVHAPFGLDLDGLDFVLGPGRSLANNALIRRDQSQTGSLTDDQVTVIYQSPTTGGLLQVESGDLPVELRALPLWEVTAASGVTTARDLREFLGPRVLTFDALFTGTVAVNDARYWQPVNRTLFVRLPHGCDIAAGSIGARASGNLELELERYTGGSWSNSLFSDSAKRPKLAFDASPPVATAFAPDVVELAPMTRLRWRVAALPSGGSTDPSDVTARVQFELGY
jgi:hypothetical protein